MSAQPTLLIFETHPIQYRAPVYSRLAALLPGAIHVAYASDFSVRGGRDPGFGQSFAWDSDLLEGYSSIILHGNSNPPPWRWGQLNGCGVSQLIQRLQPSAVLLNSLSYRYDWTAYTSALRYRIPVWMRCETQDLAFPRSFFKNILRYCAYRAAYSGICRAFAIGELNRQHWIRHGLPPSRISYARYCTPDRVRPLLPADRLQRRQRLRRSLGLHPEQLLVGFFGKLIPQKDPDLLLQAASLLPHDLRTRLAYVFVGSGELQHQLEQQAQRLRSSLAVPSHFAGFVNQSELVDWYLAADILVLPSRQAGETWGLVANEALQAGCGVVVSEAVGSSVDFGSLERVRTIPVGSANALAAALVQLAPYSRDFDWAVPALSRYSIEAAAQSLANAIAELP